MSDYLLLQAMRVLHGECGDMNAAYVILAIRVLGEDWTNRRLAEYLGVSRSVVDRVRRNMQ